MRHRTLASLVGAVALAACGGGGASVYGLVHEPSGPVEAAEVLILEASSKQVVQQALTGSGGKFSIKGALAPGSYVAEVRHKGYQTARKSFTYPDTTSLDVALSPQVKVQGVVRLPTEGVATQAKVVFSQKDGKQIQAASDEAGAYVVEGLDPGEWNVLVIASHNGQDFSYNQKHNLTADQKVMQLDLQLTDSKAEATTPDGTRKATAILDPSSPTKN